VRIEVTHDDLEDVSTVTIVIAGWQFFRFFHPEMGRPAREDRAEHCAREVANVHPCDIDVYSTGKGWSKL
jgi:hypothetical protein